METRDERGAMVIVWCRARFPIHVADGLSINPVKKLITDNTNGRHTAGEVGLIVGIVFTSVRRIER